MTTRNRAPVFVLGCPRSGTTVLYHMLLSAGGFAVYRSESNVFNLLVPRFGNLRSRANRVQLMDHWLRSKLFRVSGLDADAISEKILNDCRTGGDFLRIVMDEVAASQGVQRWADCTPDHLLYMREIKCQIPNALFIHIIRDGRDVALSYVKQGWSYPLPWDRSEHLAVAALYWEFVVQRGRRCGKMLGPDYHEVRFEDLVAEPQKVLTQLGTFIDQPLNYDVIRRAGIGSVSQPNSSFFPEGDIGQFNPVGRWREKLAGSELSNLEQVIGPILRDLDYPVASPLTSSSLRALRLRTTYHNMFAGKLWLKQHSPLARYLTKLSRIEIQPASSAPARN
jgi:hypothetical protein